jgi:hypothetical protein
MNSMGLWRFLWRYFFPKRIHDLTGEGAANLYAMMARRK